MLLQRSILFLLPRELNFLHRKLLPSNFILLLLRISMLHYDLTAWAKQGVLCLIWFNAPSWLHCMGETRMLLRFMLNSWGSNFCSFLLVSARFCFLLEHLLDSAWFLPEHICIEMLVTSRIGQMMVESPLFRKLLTLVTSWVQGDIIDECSWCRIGGLYLCGIVVAVIFYDVQSICSIKFVMQIIKGDVDFSWWPIWDMYCNNFGSEKAIMNTNSRDLYQYHCYFFLVKHPQISIFISIFQSWIKKNNTPWYLDFWRTL